MSVLVKSRNSAQDDAQPQRVFRALQKRKSLNVSEKNRAQELTPDSVWREDKGESSVVRSGTFLRFRIDDLIMPLSVDIVT